LLAGISVGVKVEIQFASKRVQLGAQALSVSILRLRSKEEDPFCQTFIHIIRQGTQDHMSLIAILLLLAELQIFRLLLASVIPIADSIKITSLFNKFSHAGKTTHPFEADRLSI